VRTAFTQRTSKDMRGKRHNIKGTRIRQGLNNCLRGCGNGKQGGGTRAAHGKHKQRQSHVLDTQYKHIET